MALFEKNPKQKTTTPHADKYYVPKKLSEEEIIKGRLVDVGNNDTVLSTQLIINEEQIDNKKVPKIIGLVGKDGKLIQDKKQIEDFKNKITGYNLYTIDNPENPKKIGELTKDGELKVSGADNLYEKIIVNKDSKISRILLKKDGMELTIDRYGEEINSNKKETKVYRNFNIDTQKGVENLQEKPTRSAMKGSRAMAKEEAMRIGDELRKNMSPTDRHKQDREEAKKIAANARKAKKIHR